MLLLFITSKPPFLILKHELRQGIRMKFYGHFAAAYGTIWLLMLGVSLITQSHIDAGLLGLVGFPIIALVYAFIRHYQSSSDTDQEHALRKRIEDLERRHNETLGGS